MTKVERVSQAMRATHDLRKNFLSKTFVRFAQALKPYGFGSESQGFRILESVARNFFNAHLAINLRYDIPSDSLEVRLAKPGTAPIRGARVQEVARLLFPLKSPLPDRFSLDHVDFVLRLLTGPFKGLLLGVDRPPLPISTKPVGLPIWEMSEVERLQMEKSIDFTLTYFQQMCDQYFSIFENQSRWDPDEAYYLQYTCFFRYYFAPEYVVCLYYEPRSQFFVPSLRLIGSPPKPDQSLGCNLYDLAFLASGQREERHQGGSLDEQMSALSKIVSGSLGSVLNDSAQLNALVDEILVIRDRNMASKKAERLSKLTSDEPS